MDNYSIRLRAALWWVVPLVLLGLIVGWETDWGRAVETRPPRAEEPSPKPVVVSLLPEYAIAGGAAARTETVERTLFNPTRRPAPPVPKEGAQAPQMQKGQFTLTGTTVAEGRSTAFLREASGKSRRVQAGDTVNGIKVAEVSANRVKLTQGNDSEELFLKVANNPRPTVAQAPMAPPAALGGLPQPMPGVVPGQGAQEPAAAPDQQALAERRRAARAAQLGGDTPTQPGAPPAPPALPPAPVTPVVTAPPPTTTPDPRWQEVYRRYQQGQR